MQSTQANLKLTSSLKLAELKPASLAFVCWTCRIETIQANHRRGTDAAQQKLLEAQQVITKHGHAYRVKRSNALLALMDCLLT